MPPGAQLLWEVARAAGTNRRYQCSVWVEKISSLSAGGMLEAVSVIRDEEREERGDE